MSSPLVRTTDGGAVVLAQPLDYETQQQHLVSLQLRAGGSEDIATLNITVLNVNDHNPVWYGMVWYGTVWYGMVWYGMVWYGMVWYGVVRAV